MVQTLLRRDCLSSFFLSSRVTKLVLIDTLEKLLCVNCLPIWIVDWDWNGKRNSVPDRNLSRQMLIDTVGMLLACFDIVSMGFAF